MSAISCALHFWCSKQQWLLQGTLHVRLQPLKVHLKIVSQQWSVIDLIAQTVPAAAEAGG